MICARCLQRVSSATIRASSNGCSRVRIPRARALSSSPRFLMDQSPTSKDAAQSTESPRKPPPATSTSAAQPFSSRDTLSPELAGTPSSPSPPQQQLKQMPKSSVSAGTVLKGINYFKNKEDPIAMEDHEYPEWLWELLTEKKKTVSETEAKDPRLFAKSAQSRRAANKRARKAAMENAASAEQQVPIYEQSINLPPEESARKELSKAMREKRRKDIKEGNFLKSMS